jgi:hypothetical protein
MKVVTDRVWQRGGLRSIVFGRFREWRQRRSSDAGSHLTARLLARAMSDGPEATNAAGHRYSLCACNPSQPTETRA